MTVLRNYLCNVPFSAPMWKTYHLLSPCHSLSTRKSSRYAEYSFICMKICSRTAQLVTILLYSKLIFNHFQLYKISAKITFINTRPWQRKRSRHHSILGPNSNRLDTISLSQPCPISTYYDDIVRGDTVFI